MVNDELEASLAALSQDGTNHEARALERGLFEVYADWLEANGHPDVAGSVRAFRPPPFRPVSLSVVQPADEPPPPGRYADSFSDITLPLELFVIDELNPRVDPRPIEDRKDWTLTSADFRRRFAEQRITAPLDLESASAGRGSVELSFQRLEDFDVDRLAPRLAGAGVVADHLENALRAVFSIDRLRRVERAWRSLRWLLDRAPAPTRFTIVNASGEDLDDDFRDSPSPERSGAFRFINNHNHPGMRPSGAVVLGSKLPAGIVGFRLLHQLAEVARKKSLPLLAGLDFDFLAVPPLPPSVTPLGRHLMIGCPAFVLRPAHPFESKPLEGSASYLLAARMADAFSRHWGGGGMAGSIPNARLVRPTSRSRSIHAASRGYVELVQNGDDVELFTGATASAGRGGDTSLDLHLIGCRLGLQLQNLHFRRVWARPGAETDFRDPISIARRLESGLRARLSDHADLQVSLVDARFEDLPSEDGQSFWGSLDVGLELALPSASGRGVVHRTERATVRFSF